MAMRLRPKYRSGFCQKSLVNHAAQAKESLVTGILANSTTLLWSESAETVSDAFKQC